MQGKSFRNGKITFLTILRRRFLHMAIYWVILIGALNHTGFAGSRVAVALYALDLGADQITIGMLVALYAVCPMMLSVAIGRYADRMSPRLPVLIGILGTAFALVLPSVFPGIVTLCISSFLLGFWNQVTNIPLEVVAGGIGGPSKRAANYAVMGMAFSASSFIGPVVAGVSIDYLGHRAVFPVLAVFSVASFLMLLSLPRLLPTVASQHATDKRGGILDLWRITHLRTTFIASGVVASAWDLFQFYFPIYGHAIGISASAIGTIIGMVSVATFVIRGIVPLLMRRLTEKQIITGAIFVAALAFVFLPLFSDPYALGVVAFVLGLGIGCAQPISMSLIYALSPHHRIAEAMGLRKTVNQATHIIVPVVFGAVGMAFGFFTVFISNALMLAVGGVLMRRTHLPERRA